MAKRDYYEVLGIEKSSSVDEIKRAYRVKAKEHHPDLNPDNTEAEENFREATEAYEVLSNEEKRAMYDQYGHAGVGVGGAGGAGGAGFGGFSDFSGSGFDFGDIFESIFGLLIFVSV